jgi:phage host-nuclease inhibitor protein Gam
MATMIEIQQLTREYAEARAYLAGIITELQAELERVKHPVLPVIRKAVGATGEAHSKLKAALEDSPALFTKPKTQTIDGVRVGYMKQKGKVEIADEEAVIARIRKVLPEEQAELLIRTRESVHKPAVYDLAVADLKRLGITITDDEEIVIIKPVDTEVDKLVDALLREAEAA